MKRKSGSQTSLNKKHSKNQAESKQVIQEENVEEGSVSGFLLLFFAAIDFCSVSVDFLSASENISVLGFLP